MESVRQKTSGKIYNYAGNVCHGPSSGLDMQRIMAWRQMELYFLWPVLFYPDSAGHCRAAGKGRVLSACHIREDSRVWRRVQITKTWVIIFVGELFFRADGFRAGLHMFRSIFEDFQIRQLWDGTLLKLGLQQSDLIAVVAGCIVVAVVGMIKERGICVRERLAQCRIPVRWCAYYALILAVILFAAYGDGYQKVDLIYAGF